MLSFKIITSSDQNQLYAFCWDYPLAKFMGLNFVTVNDGHSLGILNKRELFLVDSFVPQNVRAKKFIIFTKD